MTALQILQEKLIELKKERWDLEDIRNARCTEYVNHRFGDQLIEGFDIKQGSSSFQVERKRDDETFAREMFSLQFDTFYGDDTKAVRGLRMSAYSTSEESTFELERLIVMGNCAKVILLDKQTIINNINAIHSECKEGINKKYKEIWDLEKEITGVEDRQKQEAKQILLDRLEKEGVEFGKINFETGKKCNYPMMDIAFNHEVRQIKKARIVSKTKSGKSCNIELNLVQYEYEYVDDKRIETENTYTHTFENVRYKNIENLIRYHSKQVVQPNTVAS